MNPDYIRFAPSRVTGIDDVSEVALSPNRLELIAPGGSHVVWFSQIARRPQPILLWKLLFRFGIRPKWLPVADRDWFHLPAERFFAFYTTPPTVIFLPDEAEGACDSDLIFQRVRAIIGKGGFKTFDLG